MSSTDTASTVLQLKQWLVPSTTMLPQWLMSLLPADKNEFSQARLIKAAALVGCRRGGDVKVGQVSYIVHEAVCVGVCFESPRTALAMLMFARECCMTSKASILRTAIMMGLGLPRVEIGVMSQTREEPLTMNEVNTIISRARTLFPREPV